MSIKINRKKLPKNWRQKVSEMLTDKGFDVSATQVYDVVRLRNKDVIINEEVATAIQELRAKHAVHLRRIARIRKKIS